MTTDRPELVLLHGLGSAATYWDNVRPALEEHYRVTAVDLPGHGPQAVVPTPAQAHPRAMAGTVADQMADRGIERPHVVGLSLGGWVALEIAALGRAASVVALAPAGLWREGEDVPLDRREAVLGHWLGLIDPALPLLTRLPLVKQFGLRSNVVEPDKVTEQQFLAAARALGQAKGHAVCDQAAVDNRFDGATAIEVPTTVAFGDTDRVLPPRSSQDRSLLPAYAEWAVVAHCGHAMTWDQPEECIRLIRRTTAQA